jgi:hypothetical protein
VNFINATGVSISSWNIDQMIGKVRMIWLTTAISKYSPALLTSWFRLTLINVFFIILIPSSMNST